MRVWVLLISMALTGAIAARQDFKVALVTPGPISDGGWNQSAYQGLQQIRRQLGATVTHVEVRAPAEYAEAFRDFAARGYRMVIGHGFEFGDAALQIAPQFPRTFFVITSGRVKARNVASLELRLNEAAYLLGVLAARMSRTKKLGCIGGMKIPSVERAFAGFVAGAKRTDPRVQVQVAYIGNFEDVAAAKETGRALIRWGADFLFHDADAAGVGVFQAARETKGVYAFGAIKPQHQVMPDVVLASAVVDVPHGFLYVARLVRAGKLRGDIVHLGLREKAVGVVFNPRLKRRIPAKLLAELQQVEAAIKAGRIRVPDRL
ncbi:Purine-binding protein [bacterium HR17]|uniref:Purine-binding protein n=1 Tax=Candidatus Fervidibacter japonicus TaxID=2035412 RepID=A0A2H5XDY6_9BACT|nr:Purine-binding protein [bacterium HR17]